MSDPVRKQPPASARRGDSTSGEFAREKTRFFGGGALTLEDEPQPGWERDGTRFSSRPRTTDDFSVSSGYRAAHATPLEGVGVAWSIDPDAFGEFDAPDAADLDSAGASPGPDAGVAELVQRLRRGEFTDPSIRVDEFDEFADTIHLDPDDVGFDPDPDDVGFDPDPDDVGFDPDPDGVGLDPDEVDHGAPAVAHVRPPGPPGDQRRGLARRFLADISARIEQATRWRDEPGSKQRKQPDPATHKTIDELLSEYLGRKP